MRSISHLSLRDAVATLVTAWHLAFQPTRPVGRGLRAQSIALVLGVLVVVGLGGPFVASAGLGLLRSDPVAVPPAATAPAFVIDDPSPSPDGVVVEPSPRSEATPRPTNKAKKAANDRKTAEPQPRSTPKAAQDDDGNRSRREDPERKTRDDSKEQEDRSDD